ncbi:class A beta-lactamase [Nocardia brasiliensis]|uniref:class A beta-lactamase n=1 Tax=Nocardia brasiliensis TaxID=37326 RepID=UPI00190F5677|nr:class A beta-lactamase [Nocardia brasiliensis]
MGDKRFGRRTLLGATALLPLAACSTSATTASAPTAQARHDRLFELERKFDARLGVYALDTASGATIAHRADERFAFCSTFKGLAAAAVLQRNPLSHLDTVIRYTEEDLTKNAAITPRHVATGMTIRDLCDAAVRYSDGTAGNLLLRDIGGPAELTAYLRGLGDPVTRMDRIEPAITEATPGDPRDTSSPRALGTDYQRIVLGDALPEDKRAFLRDLLERNATGAGAVRVRAGVPQGWKVADKTGTGEYGTLNDIAIAWPPDRAPLVLSLMSSKATADAEYDQALLAEAAAYVASTLA